MSTLVSSLGSPFGAAGDTPILAAQSLSVAIMAGSIRACSLRSSLFRSAASVRRTGDGSLPVGRLQWPDRTHRGVGEYRRATPASYAVRRWEFCRPAELRAAFHAGR